MNTIAPTNTVGHNDPTVWSDGGIRFPRYRPNIIASRQNLGRIRAVGVEGMNAPLLTISHHHDPPVWTDVD